MHSSFVFEQADDQMALESEQFLQHSCGYVQRLQGVQLRKTFDLVEPVSNLKCLPVSAVEIACFMLHSMYVHVWTL